MAARLLAMSLAFAAALSTALVGASDRSSRESILRRAQVWIPSEPSQADIFKGPDDDRGFAFGQTVPCQFVDKRLSGNTPKFECRIGDHDVKVKGDDDVKVKYGGDNGEVFAEVAATRLLWALGFGADRFYATRVVCHSCPDWLPGITRANGDIIVNPASIERRFPARRPKGVDDEWSWRELDRISEADGGAPRAQRDALKLLAVFLQHTDSKPDQQRIVCLDEPKKGSCDHPLLYIHDVGTTFGTASWSNSGDRSSANLRAWSGTPVWKHGPGCTGNLPRSSTGTLENPSISEEGRQFLASLLNQLSDDQLRDLFRVARFDIRPRDPEQPGSGPATIDEWVGAFKAKRAQIDERRCSGAHS
jgi:hypothetical protein